MCVCVCVCVCVHVYVYVYIYIYIYVCVSYSEEVSLDSAVEQREQADAIAELAPNGPEDSEGHKELVGG